MISGMLGLVGVAAELKYSPITDQTKFYPGFADVTQPDTMETIAWRKTSPLPL